ncbi:MAG: translation initiation factor IF-2 N-terminal domain-containing protein, partial [Deltaproteobacteria bacterium]|nr:translation initiation factor IF-2 N-terminal domain-containing protein [Deltaproteobacteria bacterium]
MAKIRVHELAKEFRIASKEMAAKIMDLGYNIKNYMSTLEDYEVQDIRRKLKDEAHAAEKKEQEVKPRTTVRLRHRKITLKKIVRPTESEEKVVSKLSVKEAALTEEKVEEAIPVAKEEEEIKAEGEAPATEAEQLEIEPGQEVTETATEVVEELLPEKQPAQPKGVSKPKSFVKILDRPKIKISQQTNNRPKKPTPRPKKPSHTGAHPAGPSVPLVDISAVPEKKDRKKGKRVVQMSELGGSLKKRRVTP